MKNNEILTVYERKTSIKESLFKDFVTAATLLFCVYISKDSTWWTFVTGLMFLLFLFGRAAYHLKTSKHVFGSKMELRAWIDSLPDDNG